jgi:hypothetical protein
MLPPSGRSSSGRRWKSRRSVGVLRPGTEETADGRQVKTLSLTAEVYRQWLQTAHPYSRLREEGVRWE